MSQRRSEWNSSTPPASAATGSATCGDALHAVSPAETPFGNDGQCLAMVGHDVPSMCPHPEVPVCPCPAAARARFQRRAEARLEWNGWRRAAIQVARLHAPDHPGVPVEEIVRGYLARCWEWRTRY
jgi:hypothetical protein